MIFWNMTFGRRARGSALRALQRVFLVTVVLGVSCALPARADLSAGVQIGEDIVGGTWLGHTRISGDGSRIVMGDFGGFDGTPGVVRVFEWDETTQGWTQVGGNIMSGYNNNYDLFGFCVAISADGGTIIAGAPYWNENAGGSEVKGLAQVYKFEETSATWAQVGVNIIGAGYGGWKVALNPDGTRVVVVDLYFSHSELSRAGRVRVFYLGEHGWNQVHGDILGPYYEGGLGGSLAFSADGNRLAVTSNGGGKAIVDVYEDTGYEWNTIGEFDYSAVGHSKFGHDSVSLSDDGGRLAISMIEGDGFVRVYGYDGSNWEQIGLDIVGGNIGSGKFGNVVSLSGDGDLLLVAAHEGLEDTGYASLFTFDVSDWVRANFEIRGAVGDKLGNSGALSRDGSRFVLSRVGDEDAGTPNGYTAVFSTGFRCSTNEHVVSNVCTACVGGSTNPGGDDPDGTDTACGCSTNEHVVSNVCTPCHAGSSIDAGHAVPGPDTQCVFPTGIDALKVHLVADDVADNSYATWDDRVHTLSFSPPSLDHCNSCSGNTHSFAPTLVANAFNGHNAMRFGFGDYTRYNVTGLTGLVAPKWSRTVFDSHADQAGVTVFLVFHPMAHTGPETLNLVFDWGAIYDYAFGLDCAADEHVKLHSPMGSGNYVISASTGAPEQKTYVAAVRVKFGSGASGYQSMTSQDGVLVPKTTHGVTGFNSNNVKPWAGWGDEFTLGMEAMNSGDRYKRFFRGDVAEFRWYADLLSDADVETIQSELAGSYIPSTCAETCDEKRARFGFNV